MRAPYQRPPGYALRMATPFLLATTAEEKSGSEGITQIDRRHRCQLGRARERPSIKLHRGRRKPENDPMERATGSATPGGLLSELEAWRGLSTGPGRPDSVAGPREPDALRDNGDLFRRTIRQGKNCPGSENIKAPGGLRSYAPHLWADR